jgi:hypothetical protein
MPLSLVLLVEAAGQAETSQQLDTFRPWDV